MDLHVFERAATHTAAAAASGDGDRSAGDGLFAGGVVTVAGEGALAAVEEGAGAEVAFPLGPVPVSGEC